MAAFTLGNIVVYRVQGTTSAAAATFLDEYTTAGVLVQTIAFPTTTTGTQDELTDSGQATYSGEITESGTGAIFAAGYDAPTTTGSVSGTSVPRVVGIVSAGGTVDTSTATTSYATYRFTSAASADGTNIYVATGNGVGYTTVGSTGAATTISNLPTGVAANQVAIVNGQIYYSTPGGGTPAVTAGIYSLGTGLPTMAGQASTLIAASTKPVEFAFATLGGGQTPDTLYVADNTNGIEKFSLVGGAYMATGTVALAGVTGMAVTVANGVATLYVTTTSTIRSLVDPSGARGTLPTATPLTTLVTAPTGSSFKGDVVYQPASTACYCTGTLIRAVRDDLATSVAVEHLAVGDLVVTASGAYRPIKWLGHRTVDCREHPRPQEAQPVRVSADAFGENRPARDLRVSPGHALCLDIVGEVLIPAGVLINGSTIVQEEVDTVTYWHVELEGGHDILLAENMPAESYLEMGNRGFFVEADVVALDASPDASTVTHADFCRPFHADGALVEVVRAQLAARAETLGWQLEEQGLGDLHLLVDGIRVEPRVRGLSARFLVPAGAAAVWLVSRTTVPAAITAGSPDHRALGLCVAALTLDEGFGAPRCVQIDDPRLCVGFHAVERDGDSAWRWTAGRARLPASLWESLEDDTFLRVDLAGPTLPRWIAPACVSEGSIALSTLVA